MLREKHGINSFLHENEAEIEGKSGFLGCFLMRKRGIWTENSVKLMLKCRVFRSRIFKLIV